MNEFWFANTLKAIIGDNAYKELITKITKEYSEKNVSLEKFGIDVFDKYCLIILILGTSKKIELEKYKLKIGKETIEINSTDFTKKYERYISVVEDIMFEIVKNFT